MARKVKLQYNEQTAYPVTISDAVVDHNTGEKITETLNKKQDILISGKNIKTINGQSILGSGNIEGLAKADTFDPTITYPTDQLSFKQMVDTCIEFDSPIMVINDKDIRYIKNDINNIWFKGKMQAGEDKLSLNLNWDIDYKDVQVGQQYTLYIPDGCIKLQNGSKNNAIYKTYTYIAAEDSIPVIMPLPGQVTTDGIKTTTLYFEIPIESFDPENVRYAKPFGSVWCGVAGSYTISEDRLSMTINWDFVPEIGLNYTLELPEGCILFADGTKNIKTNIAYSVVSKVDNPTDNPTDNTIYFYPRVTGDLKTTIINLDSPISSFNPEDVRYERQYGNVWCSVAGQVNISGDKLTITINWDFAPEAGVTYTLVLPKGCITLENGNKNEETRRPYTN